MKEEVDKHSQDPSNKRYRDNCARVCQAGIKKKLLNKRAVFDAAFDCCRKIERNTLAADVVRGYSPECQKAQDCLAVLMSCQEIDRADLLDQAARKIHCRDTATFTSAFDICVDMKRLDLASQVISKFRGGLTMRRKDLESAEIVLPLIKAKSSQHSFAELQEWYVAGSAVTYRRM